jgi:hypothetical protein
MSWTLGQKIVVGSMQFVIHPSIMKYFNVIKMTVICLVSVSITFVVDRIVIVQRVLLSMGKKVKITGKEKECKDKYTAVLKFCV